LAACVYALVNSGSFPGNVAMRSERTMLRTVVAEPWIASLRSQ